MSVEVQEEVTTNHRTVPVEFPAFRAFGPDLTMGDTVIENALRVPDTVAYQLGDRTITHLELKRRGTSIASALAARGVRQQDRIAILGKNSIEFGEVQAATQLSGIIMGTVNFRLSDTEFADVLRKIAPRVLFCDEEYLDRIVPIATNVPGLDSVVCFTPVDRADVLDYQAFVAEGDPDTLPFSAVPSDIACLIFTSGTTGSSKACMLGHRELRKTLFMQNTELRTGPLDRMLIVMPMYHFGAIAMQGGVHARGGTVVLVREFRPDAALEEIVAARVNCLHMAPTMLQALLDAAVARPDALLGITTVVYAAAPMTTPTLRQAMSAMPAAGFLNLYGQTEGVATGLAREFHSADGSERSLRRLMSIGHPFPNIELRIVDEDDNDQPVGVPGEIIVRSEVMFRGYWNDEAATLRALRGGWQHTGDIGRLDEEGLVYLVDRKNDVIISGGENVFSPEVEEAILTMDSVAACAVVAAPDPRWGESVCAVVVPRAGERVELEQVQDVVRQTLARYKVPRRLVVVDSLPALASGKVDKKMLRSMVAQD